MDKNDFFVKSEIKDIVIEGQTFKYKPVNAGDELEWIEDYLEDKKEIDDDGKEKMVKRTNFGKLSMCKLRNIQCVPFTSEELELWSGCKKEFKDYTNQEKDLLFSKLNPRIYNQLIGKIDNINIHKKKS